MKNKKLNLNELKVKSFVTDFENGKENTVKGGNANTYESRIICPEGDVTVHPCPVESFSCTCGWQC